MTVAPPRRVSTSDLLLGQQAFAGAEDPAELEAGAVALVGVRLDFHRALALHAGSRRCSSSSMVKYRRHTGSVVRRNSGISCSRSST